jgi:hypothetical protein
MKTWFECRVKFPQQDEQGKVKNVTSVSLVDALSFTEAEAKVYEEYGQRVMGEFEVVTIAKSKIIDIFEYQDADTFYQAKVVYMVADTDSGKEKKVTNLTLVGAHNVGEAFERIKESLSSMLMSFTVPEIKESKVEEVFHHVAEEIPNNLTPISEVPRDIGSVAHMGVINDIETEEHEETKILAGIASG